MNRVVLGAIAGVCGTAAMTAAMRMLHRRLSGPDRYPLPPREITEVILPAPRTEKGRQTATMAAHFAYGAAMGSLVALAPGATRPLAGAGYGLSIWAASYLGWLPSMNVLRSALRHPPPRNALMGAAHLVWGAATSLTLRELLHAQSEVFAEGELRDAAPHARDEAA